MLSIVRPQAGVGDTPGQYGRLMVEVHKHSATMQVMEGCLGSTEEEPLLGLGRWSLKDEQLVR